MIYLQLFISFFQIGLFSIGGGYAAMPLIQHQVVAGICRCHHHFPDDAGTDCHQFRNLCRDSDCRLAGRDCRHVRLCVPLLRHCACACLGLFSLPQSVGGAGRVGRTSPRCGCDDRLCRTFHSSLTLADLDWIAVLLFAGALFALRKWKLNPIYVMLGCGGVGLILYLILGY